VHPTLASPQDDGAGGSQEEHVGERIEALAGWIQELDAQIRATTAAGDEKTLKELRRALEAWSKRDPKFEERLTDRVDVLADRVATLSSTVNTAAAAHAASEGDLACLRRELEQASAKLEAAIHANGSSGDGQALEELRQTVADLSNERSRRTRADVGDLRTKIDHVGQRVDTLATTVASTAAGLAGREGEVTALQRSLDDVGVQIAQLTAEIRRDESGARDVEMQARLQEVAAAQHQAETQLKSLDERLQTRVAEVTSKLEGASREFAASELELAALKRHLEETTAQVEAAVQDIREELPQSLSLVELDERLAPLLGQLETLASRVQEADAVAKERIEHELDRLSDAERRLGDADRRLVDIEQAAETSATEARRAGEARSEEQARMQEQLDALVQAVAETPTKNDLEQPLTAVSGRLQRLEEAGPRHEEALRTLEEELAARPDPSLEDLERKLEPFARRLEAAERVASERDEASAAHALQIDDLVASVRARLDAVEHAAETAATEARRAGEAGSEEQARVQEQLDALVQAVAETPTTDDFSEPLVGVSRRLERLEEARPRLEEALRTVEEGLAAQSHASLEDLDSKLQPLGTQLQSLARRLEEEARVASERSTASVVHAAEVDDLVASVRVRLDAVEQAAETAATEARRAGAAGSEEQARVQEQLDVLVQAVSETPTKQDVEALAARLDALPELEAPIPPSQDEELERLLTAFADRIDAIEAERADTELAARKADGAVASVRASLAALAGRLSSAEELLAGRDSHELEGHVEALSSRLDAVEAAASSPPPGPTSGPGDGRFRVELRALELRMEHAEAAARENREAVLVQLERLAARLEWRLQRLESGQVPEPEAPAEPDSLGQVVPIRGGAET